MSFLVHRASSGHRIYRYMWDDVGTRMLQVKYYYLLGNTLSQYALDLVNDVKVCM